MDGRSRRMTFRCDHSRVFTYHTHFYLSRSAHNVSLSLQCLQRLYHRASNLLSVKKCHCVSIRILLVNQNRLLGKRWANTPKNGNWKRPVKPSPINSTKSTHCIIYARSSSSRNWALFRRVTVPQSIEWLSKKFFLRFSRSISGGVRSRLRLFLWTFSGFATETSEKSDRSMAERLGWTVRSVASLSVPTNTLSTLEECTVTRMDQIHSLIVIIRVCQRWVH